MTILERNTRNIQGNISTKKNERRITMNCKHYHIDQIQGDWCDLHDVCNFSICKDRTDIKVEDWKLNSNDTRWGLEFKAKKDYDKRTKS